MSQEPESKDLRETTDFPQLMQPLYREHDEPRDGFEPAPLWMTAVFGALLFWGGWYIASYSGTYQPDTLDQYYPNQFVSPSNEPSTPEATLALGTRLYQHCAVCHQADGSGVEGLYPPLRSADWTVGEVAAPDRLARLLLHGGSGEWTVNGKKYSAPMPAYGAWKDYEIAAVLSYVRQAWGNTASPITAEQISSARLATKGRPTTGSKGWSQAELNGLK